jgi:hypothetical protein
MGIRQVLIIILLIPTLAYGATKLPEISADKIISFTLFNYDNLIADCYEPDSPYIKQLACILNRATSVSESVYISLLKSKEFGNEPVPVDYMIKLNKKVKEISNYYFVDE